jgi:predicted regulator of Ras-like GTPase activity (Roadblock/LC7/MglB family)
VLKVEQPKPDMAAPKLEVAAPKPEAVASNPEIAVPKPETIAPKLEAAPAQVKPALQQEAPEAEAPKPGALGLDDRIPSELVARACTLNGVAGAVVALADGLLVSATVPPEFKAETIAAFLPQVFSRLEQAAGTMQIGELQTLMFTAGNRPWQIWRAGSLFFAAVGRPNELLPGAQLKIIAAQLARQVKA